MKSKQSDAAAALNALDFVAWLRREGILPIPLPPRSKGAIKEISKEAIDGQTSFLFPVEKRLQVVDTYWDSMSHERATPEQVGMSIGVLKGWNNGAYMAIPDIDRWDLVDDFAQSEVFAQCPMVTGKKGAKLLAKATANSADDWPDVPLQWRPHDAAGADPALELFTGNTKKHCLVYGEHEASTREEPIFYTFVRGFGDSIPTLTLDTVIEEMDRIATSHGLARANSERDEADLEDIIFEEAPRARRETICSSHGITMADVINRPHGARDVKGGYLCEHPIHGATGKGNLYVNTQDGWWYCFRCGSSGDPLTWHAVDKGYINCGDAHWRLDNEIFAPLGVEGSLIREAVDTVERFQGQERDIMIASYALGDPDAIRDEDEFLMSLNRFNVMVSRSRAKMITLVSQEIVDHLPRDIEVLKQSRLLKIFAESFCSSSEEVTVGYLDNGLCKQVDGVLKYR